MSWRDYVVHTCNKLTTIMSKTNLSKPRPPKAKNVITSPDVYKPVGPYSQAILADKTLYVSGVLGMDNSSNMICGIEGQTRQVLSNLKLILEAGESSLKGVLKTTILLVNIDDFPTVNKVYGEFFTDEYPARMTYQVAKLPLNALIEMDAIALTGMKDGPGCPCSH